MVQKVGKMTQTFVNWDSTEVMRHTNERFDQLLLNLVNDEVITQEKADEISKYRCVVAEKNIFGKLWEKIFKDAKSGSWVMTIEKFR